eukprot:767430-Hanusia_phi.AAC.2
MKRRRDTGRTGGGDLVGAAAGGGKRRVALWPLLVDLDRLLGCENDLPRLLPHARLKRLVAFGPYTCASGSEERGRAERDWEEEGGGRRKEETGGRRLEEGDWRKETGGRRLEEGGKNEPRAEEDKEGKVGMDWNNEEGEEEMRAPCERGRGWGRVRKRMGESEEEDGGERGRGGGRERKRMGEKGGEKRDG